MTAGPGDDDPDDDVPAESTDEGGGLDEPVDPDEPDESDDPNESEEPGGSASGPAADAGEATAGAGGSSYVYDLEPDEPPSSGVVVAVADATGRRPTELNPLAETVDPAALDRLVDRAGSDAVSVRFNYAGTTVTVESSGTVVVHR